MNTNTEKITVFDMVNLREYPSIIQAWRELQLEPLEDVYCTLCMKDLSRVRAHIILGKQTLKYCDLCCHDVKKKFL